jgi:nicotinate dehydrogenase subunit B
MPEIEIERYELHAGPAYSFTPDRRDFIKLLGGGIVVLLALDAAAQESGAGARRVQPKDLAAWLHIDETGAINAYTGKTEIGQNIRTSLTQAIAEELSARPASIRMIMADTDLTPYDAGTFGSRTTPTMAPQLRKAAATLRQLLLQRAAEKFGPTQSPIILRDSAALDSSSGKSLTFAELARGASLTATLEVDPVLTPATQWKIAGHDLAKVNARDIVTGKHRYASDITRPGMLHGRILRPAAFQAKLASADTAAASKIAGITVVRDGDFLGVTAPDNIALTQAAEAVKVTWTTKPQPGSSTLTAQLAGERKLHQDTVSGETNLERTYTVAYIAHCPLEPRAAVAEWNGDRLTVWTGSQRPFGVREELAQAFHIPEDKVRVIVPDTGSAYGGKHTGEAAIEAARLAKAAGKPVKLVWSREEEFTWAYFRPAGVIDVLSRARPDGTITAWEFHNYNSGPSAIESPYHIPSQKHQFHQADSPLRQGSYRGLAATANHFARESHMDELARAIGMEPLAFRLKNAADPRLSAVIAAAAERFQWGASKSKPNQGFGMSAGFDKGGYVSCCAEVTIQDKQVKIERVVEAFECGAVVNPRHLKNQIEGGLIMGIGGALFEAIDFDDGRILNPRFSKYRVPRFKDMPVIESVLVDRKDLPSAGSGETPIVGIAPALANAIFDATGQRLRSLPLRLT